MAKGAAKLPSSVIKERSSTWHGDAWGLCCEDLAGQELKGQPRRASAWLRQMPDVVTSWDWGSSGVSTAENDSRDLGAQIGATGVDKMHVYKYVYIYLLMLEHLSMREQNQ